MNDLFSTKKSVNQFVTKDTTSGMEIWMKREDLLHPTISGNKFRKLKYNFLQAKQNHQTVLTFGGAFSNHIAATAAAGKLYNLPTIGIIRGEELGKNLTKTLAENATLKFAKNCGMQLRFISRTAYKDKHHSENVAKLKKEFGNVYLIPEGGTNPLAIKGCEEILHPEEDDKFDYICCPVGTGGTLSGIINSAKNHQQVIGFPALKGNFLTTEIQHYTKKNNWQLTIDYHFGGYAKVNRILIDFLNRFNKKYHIPLDPIYTGKMMYGIFAMLQQKEFKENSRILAIHTGGLQGISGINKKLTQKKLPNISYSADY